MCAAEANSYYKWDDDFKLIWTRLNVFNIPKSIKLKYLIVHIQLSFFHTLQNLQMLKLLPSPHSPVLTICNFLLDFQVKITRRRIHKLNISCHHLYPTLFSFLQKRTKTSTHQASKHVAQNILFQLPQRSSNCLQFALGYSHSNIVHGLQNPSMVQETYIRSPLISTDYTFLTAMLSSTLSCDFRLWNAWEIFILRVYSASVYNNWCRINLRNMIYQLICYKERKKTELRHEKRRVRKEKELEQKI